MLSMRSLPTPPLETLRPETLDLCLCPEGRIKGFPASFCFSPVAVLAGEEGLLFIPQWLKAFSSEVSLATVDSVSCLSTMPVDYFL